MATHTNVSVKTNSFVISKLPTKEYFQYDKFVPDLPIAIKRQRAMHILQVSLAPAIFHPRGVYDGKNLFYVSHRLQLPGGGSGARFPVRLGNDPNAPVGSPGVVEVVISKTASDIIRPKDLNRLIQNGQTIDQKTATATNLLQLLIRQSSNQNNPTNNGRAYFSQVGKRSLPGTGVELWRGFFQSVRPTIGRMLITIDTSMAAVYESGGLLDISMNVLGFRSIRELERLDERDPNFRKLQNHFKNRLIKTKTTGDRTKTIHAIIRGPIGQYPFQKDGEPTTIEKHYYDAYGIRLTYPRTFGVRLSGRNAPFAVVVPAELCIIIPGQLYKKRLPSSATRDAVDFATMAPQVRLQTIAGGTAAGVQSPIQGYHNSEFVVDAGMVIDPNPITLNAKLLVPPAMRFGTQSIVLCNFCCTGSWNVVRQKFKTAMAMKVWSVLNFDPSRIQQNTVNRTIDQIMRSVAPPAAVHTAQGHSPEKALNAILREMLQRGPPDVIIVLLPKNAEEIRTAVKFWGDVQNGVRTSCLREDKLQRANPAYFNNVAIKLNARLGGHYALPHYAPPQQDVLAELKSSHFMICGADVSHPGPGIAKPSIASLVWSWDEAAASYIAYSDVQAPRMEVIQGLQQMFRDAVFQFGMKNGPPQRIIFFRDGVSEGELEAVRTAEIAAIRAGCQEVWDRTGCKEPLPPLTFIVVVKRHHTVFFPNDNRVDDGVTGNCRAGLVVDELRSPLARDFYLQSHGALKGTSRSGHYSILLDENFNNDISKIQRLSFELCHSYAKATRSISIPAPIVCARGKFHLDPTQNVDFDSSTNASGSEEFNLDQWKLAYRKVNGTANYDKMMYFL
ncbi:argonaute-like protein [Mycena latifolia]|nr:argonaute-like protein [Mycena latifolia]